VSIPVQNENYSGGVGEPKTQRGAHFAKPGLLPHRNVVAFETNQFHEELLKSQTKAELTRITEEELNLRLFQQRSHYHELLGVKHLPLTPSST
jgi:hypothetical protein